MTTTLITPKTKRPRIAKGLLVASTCSARLACMKLYATFYLFNPISYKIVRRIIIDLPLNT